MRMSDRCFAAVLMLLMSGAAPALARPPAPAVRVEGPVRARLTAEERDAALAGVEEAVRTAYAFPEKRAAVLERLGQSRKAGRYDVDSPALLAERITLDLKDASKDLHLYLLNEPARYAAAKAAPAGGQNDDAFMREWGLREHHGLTELRVLPGNIRLLRISGFHWTRDETGVAYDEALRFLKDGDAYIIDLRGNGGGHAAAVQYLVSHFLDEDTLLMTFHRADAPPAQSRTLAHVPAGRLMGKPLYVLIDRGVASAGEDFAYDVQQFKLGELIGARTAGAANNNGFVPVAPCFMLSVPEGYPVHAVSQTNWEGVGVAPDVEVPPAQALEVAQLRALKRLMAAPGVAPQQLAAYTWARTALEARLQPVSVSPARMKSLAGRFGDVVATLREGALWLVRGKRPEARLVPLTAEGLFAVEGNDHLRVRLTGKTAELFWEGEPEPVVFSRS